MLTSCSICRLDGFSDQFKVGRYFYWPYFKTWRINTEKLFRRTFMKKQFLNIKTELNPLCFSGRCWTKNCNLRCADIYRGGSLYRDTYCYRSIWTKQYRDIKKFHIAQSYVDDPRKSLFYSSKLVSDSIMRGYKLADGWWEVGSEIRINWRSAETMC